MRVYIRDLKALDIIVNKTKNVMRCWDSRSAKYKETRYRDDSIKQFTIQPGPNVERYVGWDCILNCFVLSSLPCFLTFADLLSLHLVIFLMFFFSAL